MSTLSIMQSLATGDADANEILATIQARSVDRSSLVPHPPRDVPRAVGVGGAGGVRRMQLAPRQPRAKKPVVHVPKPVHRQQRRAATERQPRGSKARPRTYVHSSGARTDRPAQKARRHNTPQQPVTHAFMTRRSKSVPLRNKMPHIKNIKSSPLVAAINLHERSFQQRNKEYLRQREEKRRAEKAAAERRKEQDDARTAARLAQLRRAKSEAISRLFGSGVGGESLAKYQASRQAKRLKRRQDKAKAAEIKAKRVAADVQWTIEHLLDGVAIITDKREAARMDSIELVMDRIVTDVEAMNTPAPDVHAMLAQISQLQSRNQSSIQNIDRALQAQIQTEGKWAVQWPASMVSDADWLPTPEEKHQYAVELLDCLIGDAVLPHAATRVRGRRQARIKSMLADNKAGHNAFAHAVDASMPRAHAHQQGRVRKRAVK